MTDGMADNTQGAGWDFGGRIPLPAALRRPVGTDRPDAPDPDRPARPASRGRPHDGWGITYRSRGGICPGNSCLGKKVWARRRRMAAEGTWDMVLVKHPAAADSQALEDWSV